MVNTSLTPAGLIVKKCRPSLRNYRHHADNDRLPRQTRSVRGRVSLHCPSGRRLRARKQRTKSLKGAGKAAASGARTAPSGRPNRPPTGLSLQPQGLGALEEAHMLWAKSDFPEQPPLYVKPLHLERAREAGVASRRHHAHPASVLVVPRCGSRPAASKIWLCRKVRWDVELKKGRRRRNGAPALCRKRRSARSSLHAPSRRS